MKQYLASLLAVFICFIIGAFEIEAQQIDITGKIVDTESHPISDVKVTLENQSIIVHSDNQGNFNFTVIGIDMNLEETVHFYYDGEALYFTCYNQRIISSIYTITGQLMNQISTPDNYSGTYKFYPSAYLPRADGKIYIITVCTGEQLYSLKIFNSNQNQYREGIIEADFNKARKQYMLQSSGNIETKRAEEANAVDNLILEHNSFQTKEISVPSYTHSFGEITIFEKIPNAPSNLTGYSESHSAISLNWSDNSDNESGFTIQRATIQVVGGWSDFSDLADVSLNTTEYTDQGLIQGQDYMYRVKAYNNGGSSPYSAETTVTTQVSIPLAISGPSTSTGNFDIEVTYSWPGALGSTSDRFELEESTSSTSGFTKIANSPYGVRPQSYTFSLSKESGTYYYRARAYNSGFTEYTDVISVTVNNPVQKAYLKVVNNTRYPMIDIRLNNSQMIGQGTGVLQGNSVTFEFGSSTNFNYVLGVGFWDGSFRNVWFLNSGSVVVTKGATSTITFNNPTIGQLLSNFSSYRDWTGEYWVDLQMHMATFRFYNNGTWKLYDDGSEIDSGTVTLTSWPDNAVIVKFKLCSGCDEILLAHPFGQFTYRNGPSSWPLIQYTAQ